MIKPLLSIGAILIIICIASISFLLEYLTSLNTWTPGNVGLIILDVIGTIVCGIVIGLGIMIFIMGLQD